MVTFYSQYKVFPHADCGYCGCPSCVSALRRYCEGEMRLDECLYFRAGMYNEDDFNPVKETSNRWNLKPGVTMSQQCAVDPKRKAVEVYLSQPENLRYGFFDMITADKVIYLYVAGMGFSPALGIGILERDTRVLEGYWDGRILCRLALSEQDAFWQQSRFARWLWGAVN